MLKFTEEVVMEQRWHICGEYNREHKQSPQLERFHILSLFGQRWASVMMSATMMVMKDVSQLMTWARHQRLSLLSLPTPVVCARTHDTKHMNYTL